jgi:hypothetical protein
MKDTFIELQDEDGGFWASVEHSGDICKFIIYNQANGSTSLVLPRRLLSDLTRALKLGIPESETSWDLQTK